jgi:8-oxo-dGTP pyrophosphatase MutT (NUDIX family)
MLGFNVLVDEEFDCKQVKISYKDTQNECPEEASELIERIWLRKASSGIELFDGKLFQVVSFTTKSQTLLLELQNTSYKHFVATREEEFVSKFGPRMISNPLSVGAVVVSSDGYFVMGKRRSDLYFNPGKYGLIAGTMDRGKDFSDETPSPCKAIMRELSEEKGVDRSEIQEVLCLGLIYNIDYGQTYMPFYVRLGIAHSVLRNSLPREKEFKKFIYVKSSGSEVSDFLAKNIKRVSQTCLGNILMFGKKTFGEIWMWDTLGRLKVKPEAMKPK